MLIILQVFKPVFYMNSKQLLIITWIFAAVINGTARQPEARPAMMTTAFIGFAVVEALALFGFILAFIVK